MTPAAERAAGVSEPSWEQADPTFPYDNEDPPVVAVQAGLAGARSSVIPDTDNSKD
jgi:hypothetical protein